MQASRSSTSRRAALPLRRQACLALPIALAASIVGPATSLAQQDRLTVARTPIAAPTRAESLALLRRARGAQREFERARRAVLPIVDGYGGGRCDVRLGRLCYWHDEERSHIAEPPPVTQARDRLLEQLADASERLPGDEWIVGQRVRYMVEQSRAAEAATTAESCGTGDASDSLAAADASPGATPDTTSDRSRALARWCDALAGFAHHAAGDYASAERDYRRALAAMDSTERCRWSDISLLIDGDRAKRYRALPCGARGAFEHRFWALTRPLYAVDANDAWTEQMSRRVMARLERQARDAHDMAWGDDLLELLLRYGWETEWARSRPSMSDPFTVHVIGFEPWPGFEFPPDDRAFADPRHAPDYGWQPRNRTAYTRYAPRYATSFTEPPHQIAFFRRGDSAVVVAAFDLRGDTLFRRDTLEAALAVIADTTDSAVVARAHATPRVTRISARARWGAALVSVEALDTTARHAARARHGAAPPDTSSAPPIGISDVLLLERADALPDSLPEAIALARGTMRARAAEPLGVFWELYPPAATADTSVRYTVTVRPLDDGLLHRIGRALGLARAREPVRLAWEEPLDHTRPLIPRALAIDVSGLPEGRYALELAAATADLRAAARREIEIVR